MAERIEIGELTLAYEDTGGGGPVVVFVHGLGGSLYGWRAQLVACEAAGYRAIAYDQRGAGLSTTEGHPYSVELWAEDLVRFLDGLGIERAALVGHSVGCMVAQHAAVRLEERSWALALCGGALEWRPEAAPVFEQRVELARAGRMDEIAEAVATTGLSEGSRQEHPGLHGLMLALIASNDPGGYAHSAAATAAARMVEPAAVRCPVLAFAGSEDPVTPPGFARAIADAVPDGEAATIEGAAHWCMLEAPEAFSALLLGFLERVAGS